jgi:hypothetical protein
MRRERGKEDPKARELRQINSSLKRIADTLEQLYKLAKREATQEGSSNGNVEIKITEAGRQGTAVRRAR